MKELGTVVRLVAMEKKDILLSVLFGFLAGISAVGLFASSGYLISRAAFAPPLYALTMLIAILKMFGFVRALGRYAERYFSHRATFTILSHLRVSFYERLEPLAPRIFHKYRSGDLLARIVGDVESLQNFFLRVYYPPIVLVIVFLATIVFTSLYSIYIAGILLVGLVFTGLLVPAWFASRRKRMDSRMREKRGVLSTEVTEFLHGFRDLKIYQHLEQKEKQLIHSSEAYIDEQKKEGIDQTFSHSVNTMVSLVVSWFVLGVGAYLVTEGQMDGLYLAMLVMISLTVFENAVPMAVLPGHLEENRHAAKRLFSIVEEKAEKDREALVSLEEDQAYSVEVEKVSFSFEGESRRALRDITLALPKGSKTAIVGPSGSGKSTLLQLLMKAQPAETGSIKINGLPIEQVKQEELWEKSAIVLQQNHFFYGTVRENLQLAKDGLTDVEMKEVLSKVKLGAFSLDAPVFEKGENLSGGEKQRMAIARVMLRGGGLWMLDEPTSSVDALTERIIYDHLFHQAMNGTLVLVSHRLTGLERMDQIVVMEEGSIIERGTFDELMNQQGYFYQMKQVEKNVFG